MTKTLLALDLSLKCSGWAYFEGDKLVKWGKIKPKKIKGVTKLPKEEKALARILAMTDRVTEVIDAIDADEVVIEQINRGINRIAQKTLDALHFFVLYFALDHIHKVRYMDSNGRSGWRPKLNLKLSKADKDYNAKIRKRFKGQKTQIQKHKIDWKVLAERYVNKKYGLNFDVKADPTDADTCDAICLGSAHLFD